MKKFSVLLATNSVKAYQYLAPDDLNLKKGQIFGIAGVAGNGQKELMEILLNENDYEFSGDIIF